MTPSMYSVFGLSIRFPRDVPTLAGAGIDAGSRADVNVRFGRIAPFEPMETVNDDLEVAWDDAGLMIRIEDVGRFLVRDGNTVIVDPEPAASTDEVDLYLAGSVMGAVLHQRRMLPLHCNALACGDRAVLFCGDSGAGKSTLAAWFETRGRPLLTDDVCAITFPPGGVAHGQPGIPRLRLWSDALTALARTGQAARAVPWADGKFELGMAPSRARQALPIGAIYHLAEAAPRSAFAITPLRGLEAADALTSAIYRRRIGDLVGRTGGYLDDVAQLVTTVPIFRVERKWDIKEFSQEAAEIENHLERISNQLNFFNLNLNIEESFSDIKTSVINFS